MGWKTLQHFGSNLIFTILSSKRGTMLRAAYPSGWLSGLGLVLSCWKSQVRNSCQRKSKGFTFWVELVTLGLPSVGNLPCVGCELLRRSRSFTLCASKG